MCEIPKIPKIYDYNRDKNGKYTKRGRLDKKYRGTNFAIIAKMCGIAKIQIFAMHSNFRYDSEFSLS